MKSVVNSEPFLKYLKISCSNISNILYEYLKYLFRMKSVVNSEPFLKPVDPVQFPAYKDYISCPMDLQV